MGALLDSIKRRILRSNSKQEAAPRADAAPAAAPPRQSASPLPPSSAASMTLASPRRIALGGLPDELAALQQRFAALPHHQSSSREALQTRLAAAHAATAEAAAPEPNSRPDPRSPRRLVKGGKRPGAGRAARRHSPASNSLPAAEPPVAAAEPAVAAANAEELSESLAATAPGDHAAAQRSKLAHLKQRQARRSAEGQPEASPRVTSGLPEPETSSASTAALGADEPRRRWRWTDGHSTNGLTDTELSDGPHTAHMYRAAGITPRVMAAAAERAQPRARPASEAAATGQVRRTFDSTTVSSRRTSSRHGGSDLGETLAPWAGVASTPPLPAAAKSRSSTTEERLPELPSRAEWQRAGESSVRAEAAGEALVLPPLEVLPPAATTSSTRAFTPLMQELSHDLPADLLSLRESASLAHRRSQAGRPPLPTIRQAQSAQAEEPAVMALPGDIPPVQPVKGAAGSVHGAGVGDSAQRLAALRRQRHPGWHSDLISSVPSWLCSQVGGGVGDLHAAAFLCLSRHHATHMLGYYCCRTGRLWKHSSHSTRHQPAARGLQIKRTRQPHR